MTAIRKSQPIDIKSEEEANHLPIDRGWAWVICASCFGIFVLLAGTLKSLGMLLVELKENYPEAPATNLLWVINGCSLVNRLSGPVNGYILCKVTHRTGLLIGICMMATSTSVLGYLPRVEYMYPLYTFIFGFGAGLTTLTCYSATTPYFKEKKGLALAITSSGSGGGSILVPFVLRFLLDTFDFPSAMLYYGGFVLQGLILAVLVRPLSFYERLGNTEVTEKLFTKESNNTRNNNILIPERGNLNGSHPSLLFNSCNELTGSITLSLPPAPPSTQIETRTAAKEAVGYNWRTACNPFCLVLGLVGFFFQCGLTICFTCLPPLGKDNNISKDVIALILTVGGVIEIPCRILNGYLADKHFISCSAQLSICLLFTSVGALMCALISGLAGIIIMVTVLSAFSTSVFSLIPLTLDELLGRQHLTTYLGTVYGFQGLGIIATTFSSGKIYESTHRWENVFLFSFGTTAIGFVISVINLLYHHRKKKQRTVEQTD